MKLFKSIPLFVKLYKNRIEICRLDNGKCKSMNGKFSDSRIVFAEYEKAEVLMKRITKELAPESNGFFGSSFIMVIQQLEMNEGGISEVEKRAIRDSCEHVNAKTMKLVDSEKEISILEAKRIWKTIK